MCIQLHGVENAHTVLDPFLGIGNTALACLELGISCIGFEIDPNYYAKAKRFISAHEPTLLKPV